VLTPAGHVIAGNLTNLYIVYCIVDPGHTSIFQARLGTPRTTAVNRASACWQQAKLRTVAFGKAAGKSHSSRQDGGWALNGTRLASESHRASQGQLKVGRRVGTNGTIPFGAGSLRLGPQIYVANRGSV
jgi:hypothetical protein